ncbi:hypothetical protein CC86DRAFT_385176 [Ophiobolus disseminans]|uniref:Uncharacterized protein n=1 Tax=Ophiobolus disseminans TaxID=1469910 RepID=A0A6A6ZPH9_9PLEO|nr:hypothetical protein CC86DRAFT_385176 [Ophiobolus disseminans]
MDTLHIDNLGDPVDEWEFQYSHELDWTAYFWPMPSREPPIASRMATLSLPQPRIKPQSLEMLLKQTPNLKIPEYGRLDDAPPEKYDLSDLKAALDHVKMTLTRIMVRFVVGHSLDQLRREEPRETVHVLSGTLGSFRDYPALTHLEISLHALFGSGGSKRGTPLSAVLPSNIVSLTVTDDLLTFVDFQGCFEDAAAMDIFRRYLGGACGDKEDHWAVEGEWKAATPCLNTCLYDLRRYGHLGQGYWSSENVRSKFKRMCEGQGLEGGVLWVEDKHECE